MSRPQEPPQRLAKVLARRGVASRRNCEVLIHAGRVKYNGQVMSSPATLVTVDAALLVDDTPVPLLQQTRIWCFYKPRGYITTHKDPQGRPTVFSLLPAELGYVISVGRLDCESEGLLLLTNDGELARQLEHPQNAYERVYHVLVKPSMSQQQLSSLYPKVTVEGIVYSNVQAHIIRSTKAGQWIEFCLIEGKKREIRYLIRHLGGQVLRLKRLAYGPFKLDDLRAGQLREQLLSKFTLT